MIAFPSFLPDQNALAVPGIPVPFPAGSLIAVRQADMLAIASPVDGTLICQWARFDVWVMPDGSVFPTVDAAFAQLDAVCRQKRPVGGPQRNYAVPVADGQTVFPISPATVDVNTLNLVINGALYAPPDIAVSADAVTWQGPFALAASDAVRVIYF